MRIKRHTPRLIQLTRYAAVFPMNCYIVVEDDGLTLVDSTVSSPATEVAILVQELGLELRRLALTHAHGDHVGGVAGMIEQFQLWRYRWATATRRSWPATRACWRTNLRPP